MKVLLTGGDGFVGGWCIRGLLEAGHEVVASHRAGVAPAHFLTEAERAGVAWRPLELGSAASVAAFAGERCDLLLHLAAIASGAEARRDPGLAWEVNAAGTARLAEALGRAVVDGAGDPLFLLVSTGEVYGEGSGAPRRESDLVLPVSPYAASKAGAEVAVGEVARRTGLRTIIARPFPHTGPGQDARFVLPALAQRIRLARKVRAPAILTGNLDVVRDFLDVRDVAGAYLALAERGVAGQVYNVASGVGSRLEDLLDRLQVMAGWRVIREQDSSLARRADILHLVGDATKLREATGWHPRVPLDRTLQDLLNAQAD